MGSKRSALLKWVPGFAMIEVVLAIAISGVVTKSVLGIFTSIRKQQQENLTENNAQHILRSLAGHVLRYGCLPYPSSVENGGEQFTPPDNETGWCQERMRGIVPYSTLGLSESQAKDGHGYYFTYIVTPALCARRSVISVPPNDTREYLDHYLHPGQTSYEVKRYDINNKLYQDSNGGQIDTYYREYIPMKYSSYRAVRIYEKDQIKVKLWDAVSSENAIKIQCFQNGKPIECGQIYQLHPAISKEGDPQIEKAVDAQRNNNEDPKYKISDCVAVVLISHGPGGKGSFGNSSGFKVCVRSDGTRQKIENSSSCSDKSICHIDCKGEKVYWCSRFSLLSLYTNLHCCPGQITMLNIPNTPAPNRPKMNDPRKINNT